MLQELNTQRENMCPKTWEGEQLVLIVKRG